MPHRSPTPARLLAAGIVALALASASGCTTGRAYFAPKETRASRADGTPVRTRSMVPVESGAQGMLLHAEARAFRDAVGDDAAFPTLQVRLWIHNDTDLRLELRLGEVSAADDLGHRFRFSRGRYQGASTSIVIVPPRQRAYVDVYFNLPNDYDVLAPQGITLDWLLRIGDGEYRQTTTFERASDRSFHDPFLQVPMGL